MFLLVKIFIFNKYVEEVSARPEAVKQVAEIDRRQLGGLRRWEGGTRRIRREVQVDSI
jgi:hypothetical protein